MIKSFFLRLLCWGALFVAGRTVVVNGHGGHDHDHHQHRSVRGGHFFHDHNRSLEEGVHRCGTADPSAESQKVVEEAVDAFLPQLGAMQHGTTTVPVYWHEIRPTGSSPLSYNSQDSINVLNSAFASHGFQFQLVSHSTHYHTPWYTCSAGSSAESDMKASLRQGTAESLNVYTTNGQGGNLLGWATFPDEYSLYGWMDGVVVHEGTVPGGFVSSYNEGDTLTHEVGHWLGLYHTFQGYSCFGNGDFVGDTPQSGQPDYSCDSALDTCPSNAGRDPIHNYMNYGPDSCLTEFTNGQTERMIAQWYLYRSGTGAPNPPPPPPSSPFPPMPGFPNFCFSPTVTTEVYGKGFVPMQDLRVGDRVMTASGTFQTIYALDHFHRSKPTLFLRIRTTMAEEEPLEITPLHMVFVNGKSYPIPASLLRVGDSLRTYDGTTEATTSGSHSIIEIETVVRNGFYNALTMDGTIVVNGIVASTYPALLGTEFLETQHGIQVVSSQDLVHWALTPIRTILSTTASIPFLSSIVRATRSTPLIPLLEEEGYFAWYSQGHNLALSWWKVQNDFVRVLIFFPAIMLWALLSLFCWVLANLPYLGAVAVFSFRLLRCTTIATSPKNAGTSFWNARPILSDAKRASRQNSATMMNG